MMYVLALRGKSIWFFLTDPMIYKQDILIGPHSKNLDYAHKFFSIAEAESQRMGEEQIMSWDEAIISSIMDQ